MRIPLGSGEIAKAVRDRVSLLRDAAERFDSGRTEHAMAIAVHLRVLLHDGGKNSVSLLGQVGLKDRLAFHDSCGDVSPNLDRTRPALFLGGLFRMDLRTGKLSAPLGKPGTKRAFEEWWHRTTFIVPDAEFSRETLVMTVADQEGAHVDPSVEAKYFAFSRENSIGLEVAVGGRTIDWNENPVLPALRQIAHEIIGTLEEQARSILALPPEASGGEHM